MVRKYAQPEDETNDSLPYIDNHLSALMFYTYRLLKHKYGDVPEIIETLDSFRDLEALFSHFGIKSIEELKTLLEISHKTSKLTDSSQNLSKSDDSSDSSVPYSDNCDKKGEF